MKFLPGWPQNCCQCLQTLLTRSGDVIHPQLRPLGLGPRLECEERDSIQEAHETKKACDRKRYKADFESKKDSTKAYYDQNRELILASKQAQYQAKEILLLRGRSIPFGCNMSCPCLFARKGRTIHK